MKKEEYLHKISHSDIMRAVEILREEISQLTNDKEELVTLARFSSFSKESYIMCNNETELKEKSHWIGPTVESRRAVLNSIHSQCKSLQLLSHNKLLVLSFL